MQGTCKCVEGMLPSTPALTRVKKYLSGVPFQENCLSRWSCVLGWCKCKGLFTPRLAALLWPTRHFFNARWKMLTVVFFCIFLSPLYWPMQQAKCGFSCKFHRGKHWYFRSFRPIHTARQRQHNSSVPWDKIQQVSIFASISNALRIIYVASVDHRKKDRCAHSALVLTVFILVSCACCRYVNPLLLMTVMYSRISVVLWRSSRIEHFERHSVSGKPRTLWRCRKKPRADKDIQLRLLSAGQSEAVDTSLTQT